jgi:predicted enzyme related to lactoylglutathione lyase
VSGPTPSLAGAIGVTLDAEDPETAAAFWRAALGYRLARTREPYVILVPPEGEEGPPLLIQRVDEVTPGKARVHLDLRVADAAAEVERLIGLGAREEGVVDETDLGGGRWTVLTDPIGTHFCVVQRGLAASENGNAG